MIFESSLSTISISTWNSYHLSYFPKLLCFKFENLKFTNQNFVLEKKIKIQKAHPERENPKHNLKMHFEKRISKLKNVFQKYKIKNPEHKIRKCIYEIKKCILEIQI